MRVRAPHRGRFAPGASGVGHGSRGDDQSREAEWNAFLVEIRSYLQGMFGLPGQREQDTWLYILGLAAELEYLALIALWFHAGKPGSFDDFEQRRTLGQAAVDLEGLGLLDAATIETLKAVARLRNSVAHRDAVYGVAVLERRRGLYKGRHVFTDLDALKQLAADVDAAVRVIRRRCDELE